jgi:hypothetical protein
LGSLAIELRRWCHFFYYSLTRATISCYKEASLLQQDELEEKVSLLEDKEDEGAAKLLKISIPEHVTQLFMLTELLSFGRKLE